jgi:hypothetical protein
MRLLRVSVEPAPGRKYIRHRKATSKAIGANAMKGNTVKANTMKANAVGAAKTPTPSADEKESEEENYLPKVIIAKSTTTNENKPTYEKAMANSEKFQ